MMMNACSVHHLLHIIRSLGEASACITCSQQWQQKAVAAIRAFFHLDEKRADPIH
jgi:hypothetical protein